MTITASAPRFEHLAEPLGIGVPAPRISWTTDAPAGWSQAAYEIEIRRGSATATSGRVESAEQILVPWPADPLESRERAEARVRLWGSDGSASEFGEWAAAEAGLLDPSDWIAHAVGAAWEENEDKDLRRPPLVRRAFAASDVASARLYATAHGVYEAEINGRRVGLDALNPGWTVYSERLRVHAYDVTALLRDGENVIGAWLGDGWYRGRLGFTHHGHTFDLYGDDLSFIAQLEITHADGSVTTIATDGSWEAHPSPILRSGLYNGEVYDAREEVDGWSAPGSATAGWTPVAVRPARPERFVAPEGPPVRCTEELTPVEVLTSPAGRTVLDFGQNFTGRLRITVSGNAGDTVTLRTAEVLQGGEIYTRPLRAAKSTDVYTLRGGGSETWEPRFTTHGFRFVEVTGWPGSLDAGDIVGRVYHSDMPRTGWFTSSDESLNKLHENVVWGTRSNFVDIPTDCPQRDERLGWTGDIQVFAPTASFLFDVSGFLSSWLKDLAVEQRREDTVPWYVPVIPGGPMWTPTRPGAVWGDAAVLTPWTLFERFADEGVLAAQYESARGWVDQIEALAGPSRLWNTGFQLGDWLDPAAPPDDPADAKTDRYLVATAYFAWSARRLADAAAVLGFSADEARYRALAEEVRAAFVDEYWDGDRLTSDAQTAYALAIRFELLPAPLREVAGRRLAELVTEGGNRIAVGFAGVNVVADALSSTGHADAAFDLLFERECPSWMYMVDQGATTIWERWDSQMPDGTVNPGRMTSFNHYALGSIADWLHREVAGLSPAEPGYRRIRFAPTPGPLASASARHLTPYGEAAISWTSADGELSVEVTVPTGATGIVELPSGRHEVGSGTHRFA
ncbi:alpha-L-rhamnosidase [Microbacterium sorbitolivorans]|uniref:alpha-L-rhamnosidase n=1 Tax=Microbacterium sorbitolivorans TaxID=1867410 RepID=A0A367XYC8_9MICO|nr:alpha-L-rhamnosidase [Microbacterium sorbitolivorans]RCK58270.1 alpha-L-rhamnosidase [Microbacterium sorbitolivorans]GGF38887.1 alpha-L-rhamnosidase [Microbacterium sorbitolivorans]